MRLYFVTAALLLAVAAPAPAQQEVAEMRTAAGMRVGSYVIKSKGAPALTIIYDRRANGSRPYARIVTEDFFESVAPSLYRRAGEQSPSTSLGSRSALRR